MTAGWPAKNAEFMLHANHIHVRYIQKVRSTQIRWQVLLRDFKTHLCRVIISIGAVIDWHYQAFYRWKFRCYRATQIRCERGNAAFARQVISQERNFSYVSADD